MIMCVSCMAAYGQLENKQTKNGSHFKENLIESSNFFLKKRQNYRILKGFSLLKYIGNYWYLGPPTHLPHNFNWYDLKLPIILTWSWAVNGGRGVKHLNSFRFEFLTIAIIVWAVIFGGAFSNWTVKLRSLENLEWLLSRNAMKSCRKIEPSPKSLNCIK